MLLRTIPFVALAAAAASAGEPLLNRLTEAEKLAGWQLLFDGETTAGWEGFNDTPFPLQSWAVEEGTLRTLVDRSGGDLVTVSQFENFDLDFEWKLVKGGNSGSGAGGSRDQPMPSAPGI